MNQNIVCKKIKGMKFNNLFKQLDMIIINLGDPIIYSLHVFSTVRVCHNEKIILNVSDEFFTKKGMPKNQRNYEKLNNQGYINDPNSLFAKNVKNVKRTSFESKLGFG